VAFEKISAEKRILQAAREEFTNTGLSGARMQRIADNAGVNKALLHYYFRSKDKLYEAALTQILSDILSSLDEQIRKTGDSTDLRSLIEIVVKTYINALSKDPDIPKLIMRELVDGGKTIPVILGAILSHSGDIPKKITELARLEIRNGNVRRIDPIHVIMNIMGMSVITFLAKPFASAISKHLGFEVIYDEKFFKKRIDAIVTTACDGLFYK
jgi:TetR/AcrR family transcriptional regulator